MRLFREMLELLRRDTRAQILVAFVLGILITVIITAISGGYKACPDVPIPTPTTTHSPINESTSTSAPITTTTTRTTPFPINPSNYHKIFTKRSLQTACKSLESTQNECPNSKHRITSNLTISGLSIALKNEATILVDCHNNDDEFDEDDFDQQTIEKMRKTWTAPDKNLNAKAWNEEWEFHGKCTELNMTNYFNQTLKLDVQYPINQWLDRHGIVPDNTKSYSYSNFANALESNFNETQFVIQCIQTGTHQWLDQINLCLDQNYQQTECSSAIESNCNRNEQIYYVNNYKTM